MAEKREYLMTADEKEKLIKKLDTLKNEKRREIADRINQAKGYGDLSENSEYDAAKEEQGQNESTIRELEERLKFAVVVEKIDSSVVGLGITVTVKECAKGAKDETYTITGSISADPLENKIDIDSPFAQALLGKKEGDKVTVSGAGEPFEVEIVKIMKKKK